MAIQWIERLDSRRVEQLADTAVGTRSFLAWTDDNAPLDENQVFVTIGIGIGDPYPGISVLRAKEFSIVASAERAYAFDAEVRYEPIELGPLDDGSVVSASFTTQWVDGWRGLEDGTLTFRGTLNANGYMVPDRTNTVGSDIGGEPLDSVGEPVSIQVIVGGYDVTQRRQGTGFSILGLANGLVGKRNNALFLGVPAGQLLYTGLSAYQEQTGFTVGGNQIDPNLRLDVIEHHFAFDSYWHLRQVGQRIEEGAGVGEYQLGSNVSGSPAKYENHCFPVHFVQPYMHVANFAVLGFT